MRPAARMPQLTQRSRILIGVAVAVVLLLLVGPRFIEWNFVSSSKERIEQAKEDWRAGRMKLPDFDNHKSLAPH